AAQSRPETERAPSGAASAPVHSPDEAASTATRIARSKTQTSGSAARPPAFHSPAHTPQFKPARLPAQLRKAKPKPAAHTRSLADAVQDTTRTHAPAETHTGTWQCSRCTYHNGNARDRCEMCGDNDKPLPVLTQRQHVQLAQTQTHAQAH